MVAPVVHDLVLVPNLAGTTSMASRLGLMALQLQRSCAALSAAHSMAPSQRVLRCRASERHKWGSGGSKQCTGMMLSLRRDPLYVVAMGSRLEPPPIHVEPGEHLPAKSRGQVWCGRPGGRTDVERMEMKEPEGIGGWNPVKYASAELGREIVAFCAARIGQKALDVLAGRIVPPAQADPAFLDNPGPSD